MTGRTAMRRVTNVEVIADLRLRLTYAGGVTIVAHLRPLIEWGGAWQRLTVPSFFRQVTVGEDGRYIEWPSGLDCCADALWLRAQAADDDAI
jgi:hypothetical protein